MIRCGDMINVIFLHNTSCTSANVLKEVLSVNDGHIKIVPEAPGDLEPGEGGSNDDNTFALAISHLSLAHILYDFQINFYMLFNSESLK